MTEEHVQRRLAAILASDVVGYSRLMEQDESGTLAIVKLRRRTVLEPLVAKYGGRIFKVAGDGVLVEFGSAVNAVHCAVDLQTGMTAANDDAVDKHQIILRIGISLGDVMIEGSDLYGDTVNIAARLEAIADPGGILVSGAVHDYVRNKVKAEFEHLGTQSLKNIAEPVRAYRVARTPAEFARTTVNAATAKPSIAVLPFVNMSGDPEQECFADALTEDLITDLSRNAGLLVIARNSSFAYKGKAVDARRIASDLGVRYLLEGSARRSAGRVRINVQLIDAAGGGHLWAERFDRSLEDVFAVQDEVAAKIVEGLVGRLTTPPARRRPKSLEAYECCIQARILTEQTPQAAHEAHLLLRQAIALDPGYAEVYGWLALNRFMAWAHWGEAEDPNRAMAVSTALRAVELDPNDATCRWILAMILAYERRWSESDEQFVVALELDPNHADAWAHLSDISVLKGRSVEAIEQVRKALRLNPYPASWYYWLLGQAQYASREYDAAVGTLRKEETYRTGSRRILAASLAQLGRLDEARREAEMFLLSSPHFTIGQWVSSRPFHDQAMLEHFVDGYRKAGLPA